MLAPPTATESAVICEGRENEVNVLCCSVKKEEAETLKLTHSQK